MISQCATACLKRAPRLAAVIAVFVGIAIAAAPVARAEAKYPSSQPIRLIVPFGAGGLGDVTARMIAKAMNQRFGDSVIIDNRPGAGGIAALSAVLSAPHDGYALSLFANGTAIATSLFKLPYDPEKAFTPVSRIINFDLLLLTKAGGPIKSVSDLLALGKKRQLTLGSINPGSTQNLSAQLFKSTAKLNAVVIPYRTTGDVISALVRGDIDVGFDAYAGVKGAMDGKQIQPIATTSAVRSAWLPNVPTVKEAGVANYQVTGWNALYVATGTPQPIIDVLNHQLHEVLATPELKAQLRTLGLEAAASTPAEMAKIFRDDKAKWAAVIKRAGIKQQ